MSVWKRKVENAKFDDRELIPAGNHPAVLVAMVDVGSQETKKFNSNEYEWVRKIVLAWELVAMAGRPVIIKDFRLSLNTKAALRKLLEGWRGRAYADGEEINLDKLLGQPCLLKVEHKTSANGERTYHEVHSASLPSVGGQKIDVAKPEHQPFLWSVDDDGADPKQLPEWLPFLYGKSLAEVAESCDEWQEGARSGESAGGEFDPDAEAAGVVPGNPGQGNTSIPF